MSQTQQEFDRKKEFNIADIQSRIDALKSGMLLESLQLELRLAKRQSFAESTQDRRFITN